ncbi:MAG: type II toxin-antitoxin system VapC family toxin [Caldilineaceae bacterium]|nr:type II toxin-antitoxin system VapC family toxin [Caldilineaceae bacterium]
MLDTVVLAAYIDTHDKWHSSAVALNDALLTVRAEFVIMDVVANETISILTRRLHEQRRVSQLGNIFERLEHVAPMGRITWISSEMQRLYPEILAFVREHNGELNFHDALIALACRELAIPYIASFDRDFDRVPWLTRIDRPENVPQA